MRLLLLIMVHWVLAGCAATVVYDFDETANFQQSKQYQFEQTENGDVQSLDRARIHKAIAKQLSLKGFSQVDSGAGLTVRYRIEEDVRIESTGLSYGVGMSRSHLGVAMHTPVRAREIKEGKLVVEVVETDNSRVIWRAVSQKRLTEQMRPEKRTELVNELVKEMFQNYPPQR